MIKYNVKFISFFFLTLLVCHVCAHSRVSEKDTSCTDKCINNYASGYPASICGTNNVLYSLTTDVFSDDNDCFDLCGVMTLYPTHKYLLSVVDTHSRSGELLLRGTDRPD